jgi:CheY-like chemotaxis protein
VSQAFDPFFTTKVLGKGSGLGLSMVYGFVKQSGGHARIYSEEDEGTTIRLYFPRAVTTTDDIPYEAPREIEPRGGSEHILAVEDDAQVRTYVVTLLENLGYRVTAARSGAEALEILSQHRDIDLLFTDVVMPGGINGRQLSEQALNIHPDMKVLFTSGYSENAIIHNGRLDRGVQLISKPYHREQLAVKLREILDPS